MNTNTNRDGGNPMIQEPKTYKKLRSGKVVASSGTMGPDVLGAPAASTAPIIPAVTEEERARALLKEQQLESKAGVVKAGGPVPNTMTGTTTNSSKRSCPSTVTHLATNVNVSGRNHLHMSSRNRNDSMVVDPYLLKLLNAEEGVAGRLDAGAMTRGTMGTLGTNTNTAGTNKSVSTEFRVPEPPTKRLKVGFKQKEAEGEREKGEKGEKRSAAPLPMPAPAGVTLATSSARITANQAQNPLACHPMAILSQPAPAPVATDIQASNSLEKTRTTNPSTQPDMDKAAKISVSQPQWDYVDTKSVLGEDVYDTLKTSVIQHQKEYLEQLFDLHRAIAVQRLLVRHSEDQKTLVKEYHKEEARAKKALQKAGLGFGTTTEWHKGLHPDSQFAALSSDDGTDVDGSGDDATGSDVAASGSGGNGKSGNGSGGGSTSQFPPNAGQASMHGLPGNVGVQRAAPSGASNAPVLGMSGPWGPTFGVNVGGMGMNSMQANMVPGLIEMPGMMYTPGVQQNLPFGAEPMMWWYQDYCNRMQQQGGVAQGGVAQGGVAQGGGRTPSGQGEGKKTIPAASAPGVAGTNAPLCVSGTTGTTANASKTMLPPPIPYAATRTSSLPVPFKWWQDPKLAFGPPGNPKDVLTRAKESAARQEGTEVESAPPSEATGDEDGRPSPPVNNMTKRQEEKNGQKNKNLKKEDLDCDVGGSGNDESRLVKPVARKRRARKRMLKDPVAAASSGTSGPLPHYSSDGAATPKQDAVGRVAKLLLSISTKEAQTGMSSGSRGTMRPRRKSSRRSSGSK